MNNNTKKAIESYRNSDDKRPLIVNFESVSGLSEFSQSYFSLTKKNICDLGPEKSELPSISDIYEMFDSCEEDVCVVSGIGTYLKLYGNNEFNRCIHALLGSSYKTKFIIITYQCGKLFKESIPKYKENIIDEEENSSITSSLVFINPKYKSIVDNSYSLRSALQKIENSEDEELFVSTSYNAKDFQESLIRISDCNSAFDMLCLKDVMFSKISSSLGDDVLWSKLLNEAKDSTVINALSQNLNINSLISEIKDWKDKSEYEKWKLFIYLKYKEIKTGNYSIDYAIDKSNKANEFIRNIYNSILDINYKEDGFWNKYKDRKKILKEIDDETATYDYCSMVQYKNENALYYLTDNTENEKKLMLNIIDKYRDLFTKQNIVSILKNVYLDLYNYLLPFSFKDEFLNVYFDDYKYQKVKNILTPEFKAIVDKEAVERSFKKRLKYRSEVLDEIEYNNSAIYFIDALGVEFMSFIERKCAEKELVLKTHFCQANLPTITSKNTEFKEYFNNKGIVVYDEKRLDTLKHEGKSDYDYDKNKLPIHIVEEFNIINECLDDIKKKIKNGIINKAVIVSDHGATRLAILNNEIIKEDVESAGEHGGRVCKDIPGMKEIPNAIKEDGYCILCDYNSIKGGRAGKVEMHGGATLEEVMIPVIEIFNKATTIQIKVIEEIIKVSFKKAAVLKFYSSSKLNNVTISINGTTYQAATSDGSNFEVVIDDIKKSGNYTFEVWSNGELISTENTFKIEKEVGSTNNLWG